VIWATLRGVVLAQMIIGTSVDWHRERRALIDMVTLYLRDPAAADHRDTATTDTTRRLGSRGD